ncbi:MAG: hypothetical protein WBF09_08910 [Candidatus Acidiferrum sp.]
MKKISNAKRLNQMRVREVTKSGGARHRVAIRVVIALHLHLHLHLH